MGPSRLSSGRHVHPGAGCSQAMKSLSPRASNWFREAAPDGTYSLLYYAPTTGNDARTEAYNGTAKVATSELTSYRYQALEPARFFGLTGTDWAIAGIAAAVVGGGVVVFWLRIRRQPTPPDRRPSEPRN